MDNSERKAHYDKFAAKPKGLTFPNGEIAIWMKVGHNDTYLNDICPCAMRFGELLGTLIHEAVHHATGVPGTTDANGDGVTTQAEHNAAHDAHLAVFNQTIAVLADMAAALSEEDGDEVVSSCTCGCGSDLSADQIREHIETAIEAQEQEKAAAQ